VSRRAIPPGLAAVLIAALILPGMPRAGRARAADPGVREILARAASRDRDRALENWSGHASLPELLDVLRRPPGALGAAEPRLLERALERAPQERTALRRRLVLRLATADPKQARRWIGSLAPEAGPLAIRAASSPFRVAVMLPEHGDYESYTRALRAGLEAGIALENARRTPPIELEFHDTGGDDPARGAAAFDSASAGAATLVGDLLSVPTLSLAAAARVAGVPLLSPTATDESIGATGPGIFQIGPSAWERGAALARALLDPAHTARVGLLVSSDAARGGLSLGFAAAAESAGSPVVWHETYTPGSVNFSPQSQALLAKRVEVLFWDGDSPEAEALLRRLAQDRLTLRLGGGEALALERFHAESRSLLEGVRFVADDWRLDPAAQSALDSVMRAADGPAAPSIPLATRGYLAARFIGEAVREGALCSEEIAAALARRRSSEAWPRAHGFLDATRFGARIPVMLISRGRAAPIQ